MAKLIIHTGTHKTGTSVLQHFLKKHKDQLYKEDINFIKFKYRRETQKINQYSKSFTNTLKKSINTQINSDKTNLISSEGLSGNLFTLYSNYKIMADILAEATKNHDIKLVVFFRRQDQFIQSSYMQMIHENINVDFREFYNRKKLKNLSWLKYIKYYCQHFGSANVNVLPYSPTRFENESIVNVFGRAIDSSLLLKEQENKFKNVRLSPKAFDIYNDFAGNLNDRERKRLRFRLQKNFNNGIFSKYNFLDVKERNYIVERFKSENALIANTYWDKNYFDFVLRERKNVEHKKEDIYNQLIITSITNEIRLETELKTTKRRLSKLEKSLWDKIIFVYRRLLKIINL